jgi:sugar lactone lactonase YvrE
MTVAVRPVVPARAQLGEGPLWDAVAGCLYWVDISRHEVHRYHPSAGDEAQVDAGDRMNDGCCDPVRRGAWTAERASGVRRHR